MTDQVNGAALAVADLSDVMPQSSGVLHIVVPGTNKRTGWQITFAGPGHPKTVAQNEELARAALDKQERIEFAQVNQRKWKTDGKQPSMLGVRMSIGCWAASCRGRRSRSSSSSWQARRSDSSTRPSNSRRCLARADQAGTRLAGSALYAALLPADDRIPGRPGVFYRSLRQDLRDFAERHFALNAPEGKDGQTYRDVIEGMLSRSRSPETIARYQAELACPPFPRALSYLWRTFQRLRNRRTSSGFGVNPITWVDLGEFTRLTGTRLAPWEIEVIEELDILDRNEIAKAMKPDDSRETEWPSKSSQNS
jgi:hypothetical protein